MNGRYRRWKNFRLRKEIIMPQSIESRVFFEPHAPGR